MRALVTGGAGFIGSALVARLLAEGATVDVVDDGSATGLERLAGLGAGTGRLVVHKLDVRSPALAGVVGAAAPDVVFHLAAQVDVGSSVADPLHDASVNVVGTVAVLEAARRMARPARVVLAASGGSLYGPEAAVPLPTAEDGPRGPTSPYGISKAASADYLDAYRRLHGLSGCALALANVYGPGQSRSGEAAVVTAFVDALVEGRPLVVYGDGNQTRDLVYLDDVVDAFWRAGTLEAAGAGPALYNVGTATETSVNELAARLCALAGVPADVRHAAARPGEVRRSALDATLAATVLAWSPQTPLDEGLQATLAHRRAEGGTPALIG